MKLFGHAMGLSIDAVAVQASGAVLMLTLCMSKGEPLFHFPLTDWPWIVAEAWH